MKILGIDPGTTTIGYGVIEYQKNNFTCVTYGIIKNAGIDKLYDLQNTVKVLGELITKHKPEAVGIERLFFSNNQKTAMAVAEMRGVLLVTLANHNLPIYEFTPLQVKQTVCNYGKADKKQVQKMVGMLLKVPQVIKPDDAADALALAICCSTTHRG